jgi:hypothetical protein
MRQSYRAATYVTAAVVSSLLSTANWAATAPEDPLANLAGRWVGMATMVSDSGPSSFKCVVTYIPRTDVRGLRQNIRCHNKDNFRLHAATNLEIENGKVTGLWQDKINNIGGTVDGAITADGFDIHLAGRFFEARMAVAGQGCDQSVTVLPRDSSSFRELAASLKKC